ncbi:MAG: DUF4988 domain-containing protein [Actinobacteria bacterium]|nr:DUF4988 domain-containing protein [Actinomycetota bacterium]
MASLLLGLPVSAGEGDRTYRYRVTSRGETHYALGSFRHDVRTIFADLRGLSLGGSLRFQIVASGEDLRIVLASPEEIGRSAGVCDESYSCRVGNEILINDENWRNTTPQFGGSVEVYRKYLLRHEMAHWLGMDHAECPGGGPAPLMMQQSKGTGSCHPNGIPLDHERQQLARLQSGRVLRNIPSAMPGPRMAVTVAGDGYWLISPIGETWSFGQAQAQGKIEQHYSIDTGVIGFAADPDGSGVLASAFGGELYALSSGNRDIDEERGSASGIRLNAPVVGVRPDLDGTGYWQVASDGAVFSWDAAFHGSAANYQLRAPVMGMAAHPSGQGYWLVAADGGIFTFGDIPFYGSAANFPLRAPVVGIAAHPSGQGYWLVAADGGIFTFGDIPFYGSAANFQLRAPVVGIAAHPSGDGYWLNGEDGGVFTFGSIPFFGSAAE